MTDCSNWSQHEETRYDSVFPPDYNSPHSSKEHVASGQSLISHNRARNPCVLSSLRTLLHRRRANPTTNGKKETEGEGSLTFTERVPANWLMKLSTRSIRVFRSSEHGYFFPPRRRRRRRRGPATPQWKMLKISEARSWALVPRSMFFFFFFFSLCLCRLGGRGSRQSGDPAVNLPGPFSAQQCHARCSWASFRENHGDASGPTREPSRA